MADDEVPAAWRHHSKEADFDEAFGNFHATSRRVGSGTAESLERSMSWGLLSDTLNSTPPLSIAVASSGASTAPSQAALAVWWADSALRMA